MAGTTAACLNMREGACRAAIILRTDIPDPGALIILRAEGIMRERPANTMQVARARIIPERPANTMPVAQVPIIREELELTMPEQRANTMPERRRIIPQRAAFPTGERRQDINQQRAATIRQLLMRRRAVLMQRHPLTRPVRAVEGQGPRSMRRREAGSIESS